MCLGHTRQASEPYICSETTTRKTSQQKLANLPAASQFSGFDARHTGAERSWTSRKINRRKRKYIKKTILEVCVGCEFERRGLKMSVRSDKVKFWLRMEKKMMEKKLQEKKEVEMNRDTVATVT